MPIYEYRCLECGCTFERLTTFSEPGAKCPQCDTPAEKRISRCNFSLKGSGWYRDGYAKTSASQKKED